MSLILTRVLWRTTVNHLIILKLVRKNNKTKQKKKPNRPFTQYEGGTCRKTHRLKGLHIRLLFSYQKTPYKGFILHFFFFLCIPLRLSINCNFSLKTKVSLNLLKKKQNKHSLNSFICFDSRGLKQCGWRCFKK